MRMISTAVLFLIIFFVACRKNNDIGNNPVRNDMGYLVSQIIIGKDTTHFQYDNNNRLVELSHVDGTLKYQGIYDSIKYNSNGEIVSFRYTYNGSTTLSNIHNFSYQNDTIIQTSFNLPYTGTGGATKYVLSNGRIVETRLGSVSNGIIQSSGFWDTTHYTYEDGNLNKCYYRFLTSTYQPVDTFLYSNSFYNPHLLLGKHIWSLLLGTGRALADGESKNIPSNMAYATYAVMGTTLMSSGFSSFKMTSIESAQENPLLPKLIKYLADNGSEVVTQYFYQRQK